MKCIEPGQIQKYIDNEASFIERSFIEEHLKGCNYCRKKMEGRKQFSKFIIHNVNELVSKGVEIPVFNPKRNNSDKKVVFKKWFIYSVSAACMLIFILITSIRTRSKEPMHVIFVNTIGPEVDANRPIIKQDMVIKVIDRDGNVTELNIE